MSPKWPMLLDMTKDECKKMLRRLELEAYSSMVSAFRAQGDLTKEKKKVLQELCTLLGISTERHRAEVRRAVNDEKLATIADLVAGCSIYSEWAIEGRRLVPLMPRLVPQTAFTNIANNASAAAAQQNVCLLPPSLTCNVKVENFPIALTSSSTRKLMNGVADSVVVVDELPQVPAVVPQIPTQLEASLLQSTELSSDLVRDDRTQDVSTMTSALDMQLSPAAVTLPEKPAVGFEVFPNESKSRKRKRSTSCDVAASQKSTSATSVSDIVTTQVMKALTTASTVFSSSMASRRVSIPIGGTPVQFTLTGSSPKLSTSLSSSGVPAQKVILVSTSCSNLPSNLLQRSLNVPIVKTVTTTGTTSSVLHPLGKTSSLITPISSSMPGSLVLSSCAGTSSSSGAQQPGLKIIAQTVPISAASKLVSKSTGGAMPPIVVVTKTGMVAGSQPGARVVNVIGTQASTGRMLSTSMMGAGKGTSTLVAVGPKGKQTALVKVGPGMSLSSAGGKPNLIVVQKAHVLQHAKSGNMFTIAASSLAGSHTMLKSGSLASKDDGQQQLVLFPKQTGVAATMAVSGSPGGASIGDKPNQKGAAEKKSTVLADLLQEAGILPDTSFEFEQLQNLTDPQTSLSSQQAVLEQNFGLVQGAKSNHSKTDSTAVELVSGTISDSNDVLAEHTERLHRITSDFIQECFALNQFQQVQHIRVGSVAYEGGELDAKTGLFVPPTSSDVPEASETIMHCASHRGDMELPTVILDSVARSKEMMAAPTDSAGGADRCTYQYNKGQSMLRRELLLGRSDAKKHVTFQLGCADSREHPLEGLRLTADSKGAVSPAGRAALYRGATYSKGDADVRRKAAQPSPSGQDAFAPSLAAEMSDPDAVPFEVTEESSVPQEEQVIIDDGSDLHIGACGDVHFTDGSMTDVVEETVVTTVAADDPDVVCTEVVAECLDGCLAELRAAVHAQETAASAAPSRVPVVELSTVATESSAAEVPSDVPLPKSRCEPAESVAGLCVDTSGMPPKEMSESAGDGSSVVLGEPVIVPAPCYQPVPTTIKDVISHSDSLASGSSIFMVRDSTFGSETTPGEGGRRSVSPVIQGLQSPLINLQGNFEITNLEGGSELLEITGSTDDLDSVESKVAALHGEDVLEFAVKEKKRRKGAAEPGSEDASVIPHMSGWTRSASGLLNRVVKYRGGCRIKGEPSPTHWFLHPVTLEQAPEYHQVIKRPMDFSTIRKKLEKCFYKNIYEFHDDVMLVKHNCEEFNPAEHPARQDCEEVFGFYQTEYNRLLEKWQKVYASFTLATKHGVQLQSYILLVRTSNKSQQWSMKQTYQTHMFSSPQKKKSL